MRGRHRKTAMILLTALVFTGAVFVLSLCTGKYPLTPKLLFRGDVRAVNIFLTLRLPRTMLAALAGFALGMAGFVYQLVFRNPLASPDIIGVSSGSCAGAATAILLFHTSAAGITAASFVGGLLAALTALGLYAFSGQRSLASMVLSGIAVNALAQSVLMILKYMADPEKELASIEYWTMGSLAGVTASRLPAALFAVAAGAILLMLLYRQLLMLTLDEDEARMLGVPVLFFRIIALILATLITAASVSVTGTISFIGLLAPHTARLIQKDCRRPAMLLSGLCGSILLLAADILARTAASGELPVSIPTSLLGAPFLIWLVLKGGRRWD